MIKLFWWLGILAPLAVLVLVVAIVARATFRDSDHEECAAAVDYTAAYELCSEDPHCVVTVEEYLKNSHERARLNECMLKAQG